MLQSFKNAIIPGFILYSLFAFQLVLEISAVTLVRWLIPLLILVAFNVRNKARLTTDFRSLWFAAFNDLIATLLVFELFILIGSKTILPLDELKSNNLILQVTLMEFGSQCFLGLIYITAISYLIIQTKRNERF